MMTLLAIIILIAYLIYAYCKVGIPYCLSDTAYTVGKGIFAIAMISIAVCMWLPLMNVTPDEWRFLVFIAFVGISILAVSPYKDSELNYKMHYAGTCLAMAAVMSLWCVQRQFGVLIATLVIALELRAMTNKWLLCVELMMFLEIFIYATSPCIISLLLN